MVYNSLKRSALCLGLAIVASAHAFQTSVNERSNGHPSLNTTYCDCGEVSSLSASAPIAQPNMTDFSDPAQCSDYVLISARGTNEVQGLSSAFNGMTLATLQQVPTGTFYAVKYPAGLDQNTTLGSQDIVESISKGVATCPKQNYALYGYSQGATVILEALPRFTEEMSARTKAIILVGSPYRVPGKLSNVDGRGEYTPWANTTGAGFGRFYTGRTFEISDEWDRTGKVLDICIWSDNVCDSRLCNECLLTAGHLSYGISHSVQVLGTKHVVDRIGA